MKRIKVLFVLDSLRGGGAQRVVLNLLWYIDRESFSPALALVNKQGEYMSMLPYDIQPYDLQAKKARYAFFPIARLVNELKPDLIFSTLFHIDESVCLALMLTKYSSKLVLRSPNFASKSLQKFPLYVRLLSKWSYNKANMIIASTCAMKIDLQKKFNINSKKFRIVHNPIDLGTVDNLSDESVDHLWFSKKSRNSRPLIIAMGGLSEPKGFSYLLKAFSVVSGELSSKLVILGRGSQLKDLQALAKNLGIDKNVDFLGFQSNPFKYLAKADLFVLSSLWEGSPNALVEAMACGIPVVSTDCPSGPSEIITHGKNGLLVPVKNPEALANAILRVLTDKYLAVRLSEAGKERVKDFEVSKIIPKYEELFISLLKGKNNKDKIYEFKN